jgi:hypothetical protein
MAVGVGDILRADVVALYDSVITIENSYQFRNVGSEVDELDALEDIVAILEGIYQALAAILSTLYVVQRIRVINVTDDSDVGIGTFTDSTPGTNSSTFVPPQCCYGLNLTTVKLGNRGRKFFGPVAEGKVDNNGVLTSDAITALGDVGDILATTQVKTNSSWEAGIKGTVDGVWRKFTGWGVTTSAVTQRRRRIGVGI